MKKNVFIVFLIIIILGMGGYLVYDKVLSKEETKKESKEKVVEKTEDKKDDELITLDFDSSNSLNTKDIEYEIGAPNGYQDMSIHSYKENNQTKVILSYGTQTLKSYALDEAQADNLTQKEITIDSTNIVDMFIGGFGQAVGRENVFFLMKDGTVEYMPVYHAIKNNTFKSYGKLDGIENVIKFLSVGAVPKSGPSAWHTVLAVRSDSSFYDLNEVLPTTEGYYY